VTLYEIGGAQSGTEAGFSPRVFCFGGFASVPELGWLQNKEVRSLNQKHHSHM
jgi:hypothetical protein